MNLSTCTPGQRQSIEHVRGPLLVSAGAGSGKTFTLTQRIAYALLPESGPAASGVDEVLAITFTEKAAAEIKARVKRTLRAEGLAEEALRVDGAWISTIHGMCARILRAHALDLGLDPAFGIMGDAERAEAVADAIDGALGDDNDIIARGSYAALFDEYPARSTMPLAPSVASMLQALMDKAAGLRGGLDALDFGPSPAQASTLARGRAARARAGGEERVRRTGARGRGRRGGGARGVFGRRVRGERRACAGSCGRRLRLPAVHVRRRRREGRGQSVSSCARARGSERRARAGAPAGLRAHGARARGDRALRGCEARRVQAG